MSESTYCLSFTARYGRQEPRHHYCEVDASSITHARLKLLDDYQDVRSVAICTSEAAKENAIDQARRTEGRIVQRSA